MSFKDVANSRLLWISVAAALVVVVILTLYYLRVCWKKALEMGVDKEKLKAVVKSSVLFSIVPSVAVVAGLITLVVVIGLPYGWFRLSVIGSVSYELMSANMALTALNLDVEKADAYAFSLMAWSMCMGMTIPLIFNLVYNKKIHVGTMKLGKGDKKWSIVAQNTFMLALVCALVVPLIFAGAIDLLTFFTSAAIAVGLTLLARRFKLKWLHDFVLVISLVGAMASSVLWEKIF
ncbi:MAG: DUF5058 family protein [Lachnospiraceae bacterium]|nr:DUF5058 family protein [Lachnospiraceae bacterium]